MIVQDDDGQGRGRQRLDGAEGGYLHGTEAVSSLMPKSITHWLPSGTRAVPVESVNTTNATPADPLVQSDAVMYPVR